MKARNRLHPAAIIAGFILVFSGIYGCWWLAIAAFDAYGVLAGALTAMGLMGFMKLVVTPLTIAALDRCRVRRNDG